MADIKIVLDNVDKILRSVSGLTKKRILIGIPETKAARPGRINNAALGYIHEFGSPARNIPPRPFLRPGVEEMQKEFVEAMRIAALAAIDGHMEKVTSIQNSLGLKTVAKVKRHITDKIPPPLKPGTVAQRLRRTKSGKRTLSRLRTQNVNLGNWGWENLTPLIDTGNLYNSITYVIR